MQKRIMVSIPDSAIDKQATLKIRALEKDVAKLKRELDKKQEIINRNVELVIQAKKLIDAVNEIGITEEYKYYNDM